MASYKRVVKTGKVVPTLTTAERDALTGLVGGETIYNESVGKLQIYNHLTSLWDDAGGGGGGGGNRYAVVKSLTFADSGAVVVASIPAGATVLSLKVAGLTAFDGTAPTLKVGDAGDDDRFVEEVDVDLLEAVVPWVSDFPSYHKYVGATDVVATINPDGSTAGAVDVVVEYMT